MTKDRVLVLGTDARTHAIADAVKRSGRADVYAFLDEPYWGILSVAIGHQQARMDDLTALRKYVDNVRPDLAIVGPEDVIHVGATDLLRKLEIPVMGPSKSLGRIETSKIFARELLEQYLPDANPDYRVFHSTSGLSEYLEQLGGFVVKPDGLTAGKGVRVSGEHMPNIQAGVQYATDVLTKDGKVLVEEKLDGEEFTLQSLVDGKRSIHTMPVQDHKRAFDGDHGPNTGGMGSYSCEDQSLPFLSKHDVETAKQVNEKVVSALRKETGEEYRGVLYGSFIKTADGLKVIEFNARFGDPECLNVFALLDHEKSDFLQTAYGVAEGNLSSTKFVLRKQASVCKYVVPAGYPESAPNRTTVHIIDPPAGVSRYAAKVIEEDGQLYFLKSRGIAFVGTGDTIEEAERKAEEATGTVRPASSLRHRRDIGTVALLQRRVEHMNRILSSQKSRPLRRLP